MAYLMAIVNKNLDFLCTFAHDMSTLFLFNPENDIALAKGLSRFTPPKQARLLHDNCAEISFWLGEEDDLFLVPLERLDSIHRWIDTLGVQGPQPIITARENGITSLSPWGWSEHAATQFDEAEVPEKILQSYRPMISKCREMSHRRQSRQLLELMKADGINVKFPLPEEIDSFEAFEDVVRRMGKVYIKAPWSSSGRGVFQADFNSYMSVRKRVEAIIASQGSVMVEKSLDKILDFAMLFSIENGNASFAGYSLFNNSGGTRYRGNMIASDDMILSHINRFISFEEVLRIKEGVRHSLQQLIGMDYSGPVGVDMLIFKNGVGSVAVNPCVEINLRYTMGFVASGIFRKLHKTGWFSVRPQGEEFQISISVQA